MATIDTNTAIASSIESTLTDDQVEATNNEQEVVEAETGTPGNAPASAETAEETGKSAAGKPSGRASNEARRGKADPAGVAKAGAGDLTDPKTGRVIAKAGNERKYYEAAVRANGTLQQVVGKVRELEGRVATYSDAFTHLKNAGIEPNEVQAAISIYTKFKNDPAETIKDLLTVARQMGKNVDLGENGSVDMAAIKGMISEAMAPLTGSIQRRQMENRTEQQARGIIQQFFTAYPDAQNQVDAINLVLTKEPRLGLEGAYWKVKSLVNARGLDWNTPIAAQLSANGGGGRETKPLSTGRGSDGAVRVRGGAKPNGREQSTADIVKEALAEAGISVS